MRVLAGICLGLIVLEAVPDSFGSGGETSFLVMLFVVAGTAAALLVLLRPETDLLRRQPDLLVPLPILPAALLAAGWLVAWSFFEWAQERLFEIDLGELVIAVSVALLLILAIMVLYYAWLTPLLWEAARGGRGDPLKALRKAPGRFLRALAAAAVGLIGFILLLLPAFALREAALIALLIVGVGWNVLTAALVPAVLGPGLDRPLGSAIGLGFRASLQGLKAWWAPLLALFLLLGFYSYGESSGRGSHTTTHSVEVVWTGGYASDSHWFEVWLSGDYLGGAPPLPVLLGSLALGVYQIALKLRILRTLAGTGAGQERQTDHRR